jgi:hypothetical protein
MGADTIFMGLLLPKRTGTTPRAKVAADAEVKKQEILELSTSATFASSARGTLSQTETLVSHFETAGQNRNLTQRYKVTKKDWNM